MVGGNTQGLPAKKLGQPSSLFVGEAGIVGLWLVQLDKFSHRLHLLDGFEGR